MKIMSRLKAFIRKRHKFQQKIKMMNSKLNRFKIL